MAQATEITDTRTGAATTPEELVRASFEALGRHDLAAMAELYHPDVVEDIAPVGILRGRDEVLDFFRGVFAALPDFEIAITRLVASEQRVVVEWRMGGNFTGAPFQGIEATGKRIDLRGMDMFEVEDGAIVSNTAFYDGAEFARQVGMMPPQDSGAERALKGAFNAVTKVRKVVDERVGS
jgi:steroid delta-isomerase-like uncharacterized protein